MFIYILYGISIWTVFATANIAKYDFLLEYMTRENGFFETLSVIWLFMIFLFGVYFLIKNKMDYKVLFVTVLAFLGAMEEISWGQQLFHFQSGEYFIQHNLQKETNLHNLIDGNIFSSIIYSSIYVFMVYLPLLYKLFPKFLGRIAILKQFDIDPNIILVILFSSSFQKYFYNDSGVVIDMITHLFGLFLFGYFLLLYKNEDKKGLKFHFGIVILSTVIAMSSYESFDFFNSQYEIRESFVALAFLLLFVINPNRRNNTNKFWRERGEI